jgi:HEAT repeat protein
MRQGLGLLLAGLLLAGSAIADEDKTIKDIQYGTAEVREAAVDLVLSGQAPDAGEALLAVLSESKGAFRLKVIRALGVVREDKAVKPLLELLQDPAPEYRLQAAKSLERIADPASEAGLLAALKDGDTEVREAAARALGTLGRESSVQPLLALLKDGNRLVRMAAIDSLGSIGSPAALKALQEQMKDTDPSYKRHVVKAIGSLKGAEIEASLKQWLGDKDAYLRGFTAEALSRRAPVKALEAPLVKLLADENIAVRIRAGETLAAWRSKAAVPGLLKNLRAEEPNLRWKSAQALGAIGDLSAKEALKYVAANDPVAEIKDAAASALSALQGAR